MKKTITISAVALLILTIPSFVLAKGAQQGQGSITSPQAGQSGQPAQADNDSVTTQTTTPNLNRVVNRNNNPETGRQIQSMVENHQKIQVRTKKALQQMDKRNQAVKFLLGPDYKNAGQVRSDVVGLRNDIRQLEQIKQKALPADTADIQGAIDELQVETSGIETQLEEQLSGFSLFGWLAKLLADQT